GCENVGHFLERPERRVDQGVERVHVRSGIRHKFVAKTYVYRQCRKRFPFIVDIAVDFDLAEVTIGICLSGFGSLEQSRSCLQETNQAGKGIETTPPTLLLEVALDAGDGAAEAEAVRPARPEHVVSQGKLVLYFQQRCEDAGADRR